MNSSKSKPGSTDVARIFLVDDHPVLRHGLARLIDSEPDLSICGEAETADDALAAIESLKPNLAVVDLSLQGKPGLDLIKQLTTRSPDTRVLVLSMHEESLWAERAMRAGACGYVMKQEEPKVLMQRIRQALRGETSLSERMSGMMLKRLTWNRGSANVEDKLGDREVEVLHLIGQGMTSRQIAATLNISTKTVDAHREHMKQKLGIQTAAELLRYAVLRYHDMGSEPTEG